MKHMVEFHGYRKINFMAGMPNNSFSDERLEVFRQVLEEIVAGMPDVDDATLSRMIQNELASIQNRRRQEQKRAERVLTKQKKSFGKESQQGAT